MEPNQAKMLYQLHLRQELSSQNESDRQYIENIILCLSSPESLSLSSQILDKAVLMNTRLYQLDHPDSSYHSSKQVAAHQKEYYNEEDNNERHLLQFFDNAKNFTLSIHRSLKSDGRLIVIENETAHMEFCKKDHILFLEKHGFKMIEDHSGIIEGCLFLIFEKV